MAKTKKTKADSIREYTSKNPDQGPTEVARALGEQGVSVTPQQVSTTLTADRKKQGLPAKRRGRKRKAKASVKKTAPKAGVTVKAKSSSVGMNELLKAKELANQLGGIDKARAALEAYAQVTR